MDNKTLEKVAEFLKQKDNFVVTAHINPEGDSIGSELAMLHLLRKMSKSAVVVNQDEVPENFTFLPGAGDILPQISGSMKEKNLIILDCPVKERIGKVLDGTEQEASVVNIDHHISNTLFGDINWVEPEASSVGEMIFYLADAIDDGLVNKDLAVPIYAAIVTDTGMFNYENTSSRTHKVVAELIKKGVDPAAMHTKIFEQKSLSELRLLGKTLETLTVTGDGTIAYMHMTSEMMKSEGVNSVPTDGFINYARSLKGSEVSIFFRENSDDQGKINVSFRSSGKVDVNKIALKFDGGGHRKASGCVINMSLEKAREEILAEVERTIRGEGRP